MKYTATEPHKPYDVAISLGSESANNLDFLAARTGALDKYHVLRRAWYVFHTVQELCRQYGEFTVSSESDTPVENDAQDSWYPAKAGDDPWSSTHSIDELLSESAERNDPEGPSIVIRYTFTAEGYVLWERYRRATKNGTHIEVAQATIDQYVELLPFFERPTIVRATTQTARIPLDAHIRKYYMPLDDGGE